MTDDASPKFVAPRWYRYFLWPVLVVVVAGAGFLIAFAVSMFRPTPDPTWVVAVGIILMGVGVLTGRAFQMSLAIKQRRWQKEHPGGTLPEPYAPQTSDDAAVEGLGLHWSDPDDERR